MWRIEFGDEITFMTSLASWQQRNFPFIVLATKWAAAYLTAHIDIMNINYDVYDRTADYDVTNFANALTFGGQRWKAYNQHQ